MEAIKDVVTIKTFNVAEESASAASSAKDRRIFCPDTSDAAYPSNPVFASDECMKRVNQSDLFSAHDSHLERFSQSNAAEDQSERFLQLNWKEMVGVLANQVTAMLKTITNQTLPVENFLQT